MVGMIFRNRSEPWHPSNLKMGVRVLDWVGGAAIAGVCGHPRQNEGAFRTALKS